MNQHYQKLLTHLKSAEPPQGLFERIILAIKREQELRRSKKLLFGFLGLLVVSVVALPLSGTMLAQQIESSGIYYFFTAAVSDFSTFLALWQDFSLAILESLPIISLVVFIISAGIALFTLRLFLYKRRLLLKYFIKSFSQNLTI